MKFTEEFFEIDLINELEKSGYDIKSKDGILYVVSGVRNRAVKDFFGAFKRDMLKVVDKAAGGKSAPYYMCRLDSKSNSLNLEGFLFFYFEVNSTLLLNTKYIFFMK